MERVRPGIGRCHSVRLRSAESGHRHHRSGGQPDHWGPEGFGSGGGGLAGRNCQRLKCAGQAIQENGVALALDAAGFIPGEKVLKAVRDPRLASALYGIALGSASTVSSAMSGDTSGSLMSIAGLQLSALAPVARDIGGGLAKGVPILGTALN